MFRTYTPDDFDKHGYFKPPVGFYLLLLVLMRAYIIWIVSVANRANATALIESLYPNKNHFFMGLAVGAGALMVTLMLSLRREKTFAWLPQLWRHGKWLLWASWLADVCLVLWLLNDQRFRFEPELALVLLGLFFGGLYLLRSIRIRYLFNNWPPETLL